MSEETKEITGTTDEATLDDQSKRALGFLRNLLVKMQMNADVIVAPDDGESEDDEIRFEIEGPDAGRIIGKRGRASFIAPAKSASTSRSTRKVTARATKISSRRWRVASESALRAKARSSRSIR